MVSIVLASVAVGHKKGAEVRKIDHKITIDVCGVLAGGSEADEKIRMLGTCDCAHPGAGSSKL